MKPSASPIDATFKSKKILRSSSKSLTDEIQSPDPNTPQKSIQLPRRTRNGGVALSVKEVKKFAEGLRKSQKKESSDQPDPILSSTPLSKSKKQIPIKVPEKYEILVQFFKSMESSIRLLQLKRTMTTFTNISIKIESLTDRRFTYAHLAQLKYILPEEIILKKVLLQDERTLCMKSDLQVTLQNDSFRSLEKVFRSRLLDFSKAHPEGDDVPEETLPEPFNQRKQILPNMNEASSLPLPVESSSSDTLPQQNSVMLSHLSGSFQRRFSQKVPIPESEKTSLLSTIPLKPSLNETPSKKESPCFVIQSPLKCSSKLPIIKNTLTSGAYPARLPPSSPLATCAEIKPKKNEDCSSKDVDVIEGTPAKVISTPARLMTITPDLQTPKRCRVHQDDDLAASPNKLVRRPPRNRSLFNTPVKNAKAKEKINEEGRSSVELDSIKLLSEELVQSIRENEKKVLEEQDPDISHAKWRKRMIACLPRMFDMIHLIFQSNKRSVATKVEVIEKIVANHLDIVDGREVEEQLTLLKELVPDWISEKVASSGDVLLCINKMRSAESLRRSLAEAE
ncbi:CDT1 Geminin-binding domain-like [Macleaya cordata]|uniref:CDT1 Geminin-binding domain-like n=1 Tax=Macleaya cordata TaxID=56857 RepID=A0A200PW36_MACCD|nr:CDT1 Geminin-binding domain-like [Macleaya cordata]